MQIIDQLVVTLGIDATAFKRGQREVNDSWQKARGTALQHGRAIEDSNKKLLESFNKLKIEAFGFLTALLGAREIKDFIENITKADAAVGRLAANIGEQPQMLQAWSMAVERMGGKSEDATASLTSLSKAFYGLKYNGKALPQEIYRIYAAAGRVPDTAHGLDKFLSDTAGALKLIAQTDRSAAFFFGQGMGLTPAMVSLMIQYGDGILKVVNANKGLAATDEQIANAQKLLDKWMALQQTTEKIGTDIANWFSPAFQKILDELKYVFDGIERFTGYTGPQDLSPTKQQLRKDLHLDRWDAGSQVSKSNPLPVQVVPNPSDAGAGSGGSWWDWLTGGSRGGAGGSGGGGAPPSPTPETSPPTPSGGRGRAGVWRRPGQHSEGGAAPPVAANIGDSTIPGFTAAETQSYLNILGQRESGNAYIGNNAGGYGGRWQMGEGEVAGTRVKRDADWYKNVGGVQDKSMMRYTIQHYNDLVAQGVITPGMSHQEIAGYLAAAHLGGVKGAVALSKGQIRRDGNGTPTSSYFQMMSKLNGGSASAAPSPWGTLTNPFGAQPYKNFGELYKDGKTFGHQITGATDKGAFVDGQWIPFWAHLPGSPENVQSRAPTGGATADDVANDNAAGSAQIRRWEKPRSMYHRLWGGMPGLTPPLPAGGVPLSHLQTVHPVTTSTSSNAMHVGSIHVNAPQATDATGIASAITGALGRYGFAMMGQSGQV